MKVKYTNYKRETAIRDVEPLGSPYWGSNEWHPEPQWLLPVFDIEKKEKRDFALQHCDFTCNPAGGKLPVLLSYAWTENLRDTPRFSCIILDERPTQVTIYEIVQKLRKDHAAYHVTPMSITDLLP